MRGERGRPCLVPRSSKNVSDAVPLIRRAACGSAYSNLNQSRKHSLNEYSLNTVNKYFHSTQSKAFSASKVMMTAFYCLELSTALFKPAILHWSRIVGS